MRKFLSNLADADLNLIRDGFASSLGEDYRALTRSVLVDRIVDYCRDYRFVVADLKYRFLEKVLETPDWSQNDVRR